MKKIVNSNWAPGSWASDPMVKKYHLTLERPTLENPTGDVDRVISALQDLVSKEGRNSEIIDVPLSLIRKTSRVLRAASFRVTAVLAQKEQGWELLDLLEGYGTKDCIGLAVDVGTTTLSFYLVNMANGEMMSRLVTDNPQIVHGEDILTRIHFCQKAGGLETLQDLAVRRINEAIAKLAGDCGIRPENIYAVSVAGNPTMTHLLLGLDPYYLCREPYVPTVNRSLLLRAADLKLNVHPDAPVYVFPCMGSYFGGDVVAGILASGMHRKTGVSILVDVGTNAEIVLGNRDWLVVCAGAAGPALESGGAKAGMRAMNGAIESVRIDSETLEPTTEVIGGGPAKGICGSGLIDLVAELYLAGAIDSKGRIHKIRRTDRIKKTSDTKGYALVMASKREGTEDIVIDELDIGNLLRAKGAMYTALTLVTERLGIGFNDLETFFVAGSFGEHIDPRHAVVLGMVPDIPPERFEVLGNSAGLGACLMLVSFGLRNEVESIRQRTAYVQLTTDNEFMNRLNAAIFIPHTQRELFPSVPRHGGGHVGGLGRPLSS